MRPSSAMDLGGGKLFPLNPTLSQQENRHPRIKSGLPGARAIYGRAIEEYDRTMFESVRIKKPYKSPRVPALFTVAIRPSALCPFVVATVARRSRNARER